MDEIKRALLGDREAQRAVTERFEILPCPCCKKESYLFVKDGVRVVCGTCGCTTVSLIDAKYGDRISGCAVKKVIEKWNNRPQILID